MHYKRWKRTGDPGEAALRLLRNHPPICSVQNCDKPHFAKGHCQMHYTRLLRTGMLTVEQVQQRDSDPLKRLEKYVEVQPNGCWKWTLTLDENGYGRVGYKGNKFSSHRWVYELLVGPIPEGMQIDHICHSQVADSCVKGPKCPHRACVNPEHLEPVTAAINSGRGNSAVKTHCIRGHLLSEENIYRTPSRPNKRSCIACRKINNRLLSQRRKAKRQALKFGPAIASFPSASPARKESYPTGEPKRVLAERTR